MASILQIHLVPCLSDNYAYLLHDTVSGITGVVDPSQAEPVISALESKGLSLDYILNTHHHLDHTGGNTVLKKKYKAKVIGGRVEELLIPGIDLPLNDEDWKFGNFLMHAIHTPGHTRGHVCYYFPEAKAVFTGDTLFSIGCGRVFEGTTEQMWSSLSKLALLPHDTRVYCGHEYTQSNAKFALSVEPSNVALQTRNEEAAHLRRKGLPTIPSTMGDEKEYNPFLRPFSAELRVSVHKDATATNAEVFAAVRLAKDRF